MDTDEMERQLGVMQLSDSIFPTGNFATSGGLEYLYLNRQISGADGLAEMIRTAILQQIGPTDCVALSHASGCMGRGDFEGVIEADGAAFAAKPVKEARDAQVRSGIQLAKCVAGFAGGGEFLGRYLDGISGKRARGIFPVSFAVCCNALDIGRDASMAMLLYGFCTAAVGAGLRLGMIQHLEGQEIIHRTKPAVVRAVRENSERPLSEMWQFAPRMDIVQMAHEDMDSKMFIT